MIPFVPTKSVKGFLTGYILDYKSPKAQLGSLGFEQRALIA
jgi:hypothetical protein